MFTDPKFIGRGAENAGPKMQVWKVQGQKMQDSNPAFSGPTGPEI